MFFIYARLVGAVNRHAVINPEAVAGVEIVVTINRVHTLRGSSDLTELVPCTAMLLQRLGDPSDLSSPPLTPDNESPAVGNAQALVLRQRGTGLGSKSPSTQAKHPIRIKGRLPKCLSPK